MKLNSDVFNPSVMTDHEIAEDLLKWLEALQARAVRKARSDLSGVDNEFGRKVLTFMRNSMPTRVSALSDYRRFFNQNLASKSNR